ncbi:hypothetical protein [Xanthomonas phage BUDD]|nr:hypothetical protein [Xanthomonas phage BUDD]
MPQPKYPMIGVVVVAVATDWELVKEVNKELLLHGVSPEARRAFWTEVLALDNAFRMGEIARQWVTVHPTIQ